MYTVPNSSCSMYTCYHNRKEIYLFIDLYIYYNTI